jgi:hypothetical protein
MVRGSIYQLTAAFQYELSAPGSPLVVSVPQGFKTDLASVPWVLRWLFPPAGPWAKAAVLHDWGYCGGTISLPDGGQITPTRFWWDVIFLEAMAVLEVPRLTRWAFFVAVRAFGGRGWQEHQG